MSDPLVELAEALRTARDATDASEALLDQLALVTLSSLDEGGPRVARCWVHLRSPTSYRTLACRSATGESRPDPRPSATLWQLVRSRAQMVVVDALTPSFSTPDGAPLPPPGGADGWLGGTLASLRGRGATHVCAVPLRTPGGQIIGLATVELDAPASVGGRFRPWERCAARIQALADLSAPYMDALPPRTEPSVEADPMLPVVGRRMAPVLRALESFSAFDATILLRGATGTGKSHLARWCHARSPRAEGPFVVAAVHEEADGLRGAGLFGWRRGAFTGAVADRPGDVSRAEGGTLFIDDVDKLDLAVQSRLLRLLDERRYRVLGESHDRLADVRFVVATNADLEAAVADGRFLPDLYHRIDVLPVSLPPLSRRTDEIAAWTRVLGSELCRRVARSPRLELSAAAEVLLEAQPWPGNLRQLHSVVTRAIALSSPPAEGQPTRLGRDEIAGALALGRPGDSAPLDQALRQAASAFVQVAAERFARGEPPLELAIADGFRGYVLDAALSLAESPAEACEMLGLGAQIPRGNHLRTIRREQARAESLREVGERSGTG